MIHLFNEGYRLEDFFPILDTPSDCKHPVEDDEEDEDDV